MCKHSITNDHLWGFFGGGVSFAVVEYVIAVFNSCTDK